MTPELLTLIIASSFVCSGCICLNYYVKVKVAFLQQSVLYALIKSLDEKEPNIAIVEQNKRLVDIYLKQRTLIGLKKDTIRTLESALTRAKRQNKSLRKVVTRVNDLEYENMTLRYKLCLHTDANLDGDAVSEGSQGDDY